jgi:hypothetical protein
VAVAAVAAAPVSTVAVDVAESVVETNGCVVSGCGTPAPVHAAMNKEAAAITQDGRIRTEP